MNFQEKESAYIYLKINIDFSLFAKVLLYTEALWMYKKLQGKIKDTMWLPPTRARVAFLTKMHEKSVWFPISQKGK